MSQPNSANSHLVLLVGGFQLMNDIWAAPIEVAIALWLLERELGVACVVPAIIAAGVCPAHFESCESTTMTYNYSFHLSHLQN